MPEAGELSVILDGAGEPVCVIRITGVEVRRFGDVDEEFAWVEGGATAPGLLARGAPALLRREGRPTDEDSEVVLERFELLWAPSGAPP